MRVYYSGFVALILCLSVPAVTTAGGVNFASGTDPIMWKVSSVKYYVNPAGSDDISNGTDLEKVDESFSDWANLPCSGIQAVNSGTAGNQNMLTNGNPNGKSEVTWVENAAWKYGSGVLGITSPLFYENGLISEADIALNGLHHTWTTASIFNKVDTKSIVLHEVGHWFGIQHYLKTDYPQNDPPTMIPAWPNSTSTRTLEPQDTVPFCYLYGNKSCSSNNDCPYVVAGNSGNEYIADQYTCQSGTCVLGGGGSTGGGTSGGGTDPTSCNGKCGNQPTQQDPCACDAACQQYGDCCPDYIEICINGGATGGGEEGSEETGGGTTEAGGDESTGESPEEGGQEGSPESECPDGLGFEGCCDDLTLTWCDNGKVGTLECSTTCGWDEGNGFYNCNKTEPEPSGTFPLYCNNLEGGGSTGGETTGGSSSGEESSGETPEDIVCVNGITDKGCCDGLTLNWCDDGVLKTSNCASSCGWSAETEIDGGYYNCNEEPVGDPQGLYPLICPGGSGQDPTEGGTTETPENTDTPESTDGTEEETTEGVSPTGPGSENTDSAENGETAPGNPENEEGATGDAEFTNPIPVPVGGSGNSGQEGGTFIPAAGQQDSIFIPQSESNSGGCETHDRPLGSAPLVSLFLLLLALQTVRKDGAVSRNRQR